jgi:N utilization substance protein A
VEKLKAAGVTTVESLADMTPEQLEAIEGIGPKTVEKISIAVNNYFSSLEGGEAVVGAESEGIEASASAEATAEGPSEPAELSADTESVEIAEPAADDDAAKIEAAGEAAEGESADTAPSGNDTEPASEQATEDEKN